MTIDIERQPTGSAPGVLALRVHLASKARGLGSFALLHFALVILKVAVAVGTSAADVPGKGEVGIPIA